MAPEIVAPMLTGSPATYDSTPETHLVRVPKVTVRDPVTVAGVESSM